MHLQNNFPKPNANIQQMRFMKIDSGGTSFVRCWEKYQELRKEYKSGTKWSQCRWFNWAFYLLRKKNARTYISITRFIKIGSWFIFWADLDLYCMYTSTMPLCLTQPTTSISTRWFLPLLIEWTTIDRQLFLFVVYWIMK